MDDAFHENSFSSLSAAAAVRSDSKNSSSSSCDSAMLSLPRSTEWSSFHGNFVWVHCSFRFQRYGLWPDDFKSPKDFENCSRKWNTSWSHGRGISKLPFDECPCLYDVWMQRWSDFCRYHREQQECGSHVCSETECSQCSQCPGNQAYLVWSSGQDARGTQEQGLRPGPSAHLWSQRESCHFLLSFAVICDFKNSLNKYSCLHHILLLLLLLERMIKSIFLNPQR